MRKQIEKRPLIVCLAGLIVGITLVHFPFNGLLFLGLLAYCRNLKLSMLAAISLGIGLLLWPQDLVFLNAPIYARGVFKIISVPYSNLVDTRCDALVQETQVRLIVPLGSEIHYGDVLKGGVVVSPVPLEQRTGYRNAGLEGIAHINKITFLQRGPAIFRWADAFRNRFNGYLDSELGRNEASWVEAMWFGGQALAFRDRNLLVTAGASMFVSASGMQVYLLFAIVVWIFGGVFRLDRRVQIGAGFVVLLLYWLASGMHSAALRASLTCLVVASAYLFGREPDVCSVAALAGIAYLLKFPLSVYSMGFQISMLVPISVGLFYRPSLRRGIPGHFINLAKVLAIALLAGQPIVAANTGYVSLAEILTFVVLGFITPVILLTSALSFASSFVLRSLGRGLLFVLVFPLTEFFRLFVEKVSGLPLQFDLPAFNAYFLCLYYGAWLLTWRQYLRPADDEVDQQLITVSATQTLRDEL